MLIATLGPSGSNHELIALRYLAKYGLAQHGQPSSHLALFDRFEAAFEALLAGRVSHVLQCTAHASHGDCVGRYMHRAFPIDAFIAASKPLAVLGRKEIARPRSLGLQPATRHYTDVSGYAELIDVPTTVAVAEGLLAGHYDAGICALEYLERYPARLRLIQALGPAMDTWVIFARQPLSASSPLLLE
ncbi:hypothetical protein R5M92_10315 [Halomonas sp. Bachu 37]|uniref:hypothetical protein n=1 Tax=Halomonas kashgarensis TaxID=3084920 RepID=UPI003217A20E